MGVIGRVSRLSRQLEQRLDPVFARHGLEQGLFDVLATLRRSGEPYRMRPADLAASVMLTSSGITKRLDRLEASGLVVRHPDPQDRRGLLIELTPAGSSSTRPWPTMWPPSTGCWPRSARTTVIGSLGCCVSCYSACPPRPAPTVSRARAAQAVNPAATATPARTWSRSDQHQPVA